MTDSTPASEPLLAPEEHRLNILPIRHPHAWEWYERARAAYWVPGEVDLSQDVADWKALTDPERHFLSMVLAFFASADGIVSDNLAERFGREVQVREVQAFYDFQKTMENIHNEMYGLLIETYLSTDASERERLFAAVQRIECIRRKAEWAQRWISDPTSSFAARLVAFAVVEGVFFSGSFCAIFWIKRRGVLPGLCTSNHLIARDEGMHQEFAAFLYTTMVANRLAEEEVHRIVGEAVELERAFCCEALPVSMIGMNADQMAQYIRFVADRLLVQLGVSKLYHAANPFDWMDLIALRGKTNFFEHRVTEYQKAGARPAVAGAGEAGFTTAEDF